MSNFSNNPYESPAQDGIPTGYQPDITGKVKPPAVALAICGGIAALHAVYALIRNLTGMNANDEGPPPNIQENPALLELYEALLPYNGVINIGVSVLQIVVSLLILYGGLQMFRQKNYGISMAAAILAIFPCIWICGCCGIGNGIGIWAVVILMSADVKSAFS